MDTSEIGDLESAKFRDNEDFIKTLYVRRSNININNK
jgi:hypothetical protein